MRNEIKIVLIGTGGYGQYYLETLLDEFPKGAVKVVGVVDPFCTKMPLYHELKRRDIPDYPTIRRFFKENKSCDLAVISSPIHFHKEHVAYALSHGCHVLCDKPLAATVEDVDYLISIRDQFKRKLWVGYQWSFSSAIQELKQDILNGKYGKLLSMKTICFWPRDFDYYNRNAWAGKIKSKGGRWVLDSPANNAMAHFIHNMLYLAGDEMQLSSIPKEIEAELYRAYPIENYDTIACRIIEENGVEMLFYGSHVTKTEYGPRFKIILENAIVEYEDKISGIVARNKSGVIKKHGAPDDDHQFKKLFHAVNAINIDTPIICGPEAARSQVVCINQIHKEIDKIKDFPQSMKIHIKDENRIYIDQLDQILQECYKQRKLPGEMGFLH